MKRIIFLGLFGIVLFGVSASLSFYLNGMNTKVSDDGEQEAKASNEKASGKAERPRIGEIPPPVVRAPFNKYADSTVLLAEQLKLQEQQLAEREKKLKQRERQLQLILEANRREFVEFSKLKAEIEALLQRAKDAAAAVEKKAEAMKQENAQAAKKLAELQKQIVTFESEEASTIKKRAALFESMDSKKAAELLESMIQDGKLDVAAKIVAAMTERNAAKVMDEFSSQEVAAQLVDRLLKIRQVRQTPASP